MDLPTKWLIETPVLEAEIEFGTDEDKVNPKKSIPKLFCQVGDKTSGWHSKTVQKNDAWNLTSSNIFDCSRILTF